MKVLIDMTNSPHVLFFKPIIQRLEERGHQVKIIARDHAQTKGLLDHFGLKYLLIGEHAGKDTSKKLFHACSRVMQIARYIEKNNPDVCISHQSPYIIYAAFLKGKKSVYIFDNDRAKLQNGLTFPLATKVMCPIFTKANKRTIRYSGLKEMVYLSSWPIKKLKFRRNKEKIILVRTEIDSAAYHRGNSLINLVKALAEKYDVLVSPRSEKQKKAYEKIDNVNIIDGVVDGPSLINSVDLIISGGGTMNREAAILGKPTISTYSGKLLSVDSYLIKNKLMDINLEPSFSFISQKLKQKSIKMDYKKMGELAIQRIITVIEN